MLGYQVKCMVYEITNLTECVMNNDFLNLVRLSCKHSRNRLCADTRNDYFNRKSLRWYREGTQRGDFTIVQSVSAVRHTHRHRHCHHCHRFAYAAPTRGRTFTYAEWKVDRNTTISYNLWLVGSIKCSRLACTIN